MTSSPTPSTHLAAAGDSPAASAEDVRWHFDVDIVGSCNLACPSCPVGNSPEVRSSTGVMSPELLRRILAKATSECSVRFFGLYNWTEPFLHPDLPAMVATVNSFGVPCGLSSNLNILKDIDGVLAAEPRVLRVSVSGFTQETYGATHQRGDIEVVKANMAAVSEARRRTRASTRLQVLFHRYLGNHEDEARMKAYAEGLGFEFEPVWAYLMPLGKLLAFAEPGSTSITLDDDDRQLIDRLALPLDASIEAARRVADRPCKLRDRQMAITATGEVMLCCSVHDPAEHALGSFLDIPLADLQRRKYEHTQCDACMRNGLHALATYASPELDTLALQNVARHHPEARLSRLNVARRQHHGVRGWPRKVRRKTRQLLTWLGKS